MSSTAAVSLEALASMDLEELRSAWRALYGDTPKLRSVDLLRRLIGWRLQAGEDEAAAALRDRLDGTSPVRPSGKLREGDVLERVWRGVRHQVVVGPAGTFLCGGLVYDSLSAVARAIAGSRWNGPRFFGLRDPQ